MNMIEEALTHGGWAQRGKGFELGMNKVDLCI